MKYPDIFLCNEVLSTVQQIKSSLDLALWLDYYHGLKIQVWNLLV